MFKKENAWILWSVVVAALVVVVGIYVWPGPQIRENRAEKAQVAEALEAGCTANGVEDPNGNPVVFEDGEQLPESDWVCEAESPNGPYNWVRKEEEAPVVTESAPEPEAPPVEETEEAEGQAAPRLAPASSGDEAGSCEMHVAYEHDEDTVYVYADSNLIAEVEFLSTEDNMPSEWLRDRPCISYLYQSGIGNEAELHITMFENASFAADGDAFVVNDMPTLGIVDNAADALIFADGPGEYYVTGWSFGIAFAPYRAGDDKAGYALTDRHNAINWDNRPEFWIPSMNGGGVPVPIE